MTARMSSGEGVLNRLPEGTRILILRLRSLGDCVLTTPALAILRRARPDARIGVVVERRFRDVFENHPDVDDLLEPQALSVRRWRAGLCLNLHGGTRSLLLALASGAAIRVGFGHFRAARVYHVRIRRAQEILGVDRKVHTAEHLASAMFELGAPKQEIPPARLAVTTAAAARPYAVIHPLASTPEKTWPAGSFLEAARRLESQRDLEPVFLGAAGEDLTPYGEFRRVQATLAEAMRLIAGAALFLGNDSGPAHVAAACRVPLVVLFGASDAAIWGPWKAAAEVLSSPRGIAAITAGEALAALARLRVPV